MSKTEPQPTRQQYETACRKAADALLNDLGRAFVAGRSKQELLARFGHSSNPMLSALLSLLIETVFHDIAHGTEHRM